MDVYPPGRREPVRIDYFGDEIDSMRTFDPGTQRSRMTKEVTLVRRVSRWPNGGANRHSLRALDLDKTDYATRQRMSEEIERLIAGEPFTGIEFYLPYLYPRGSTLLDFLPRNALVLLDDMVALESAALGLENQSLGMRADMVSDRQLPPNVAVPYLTWEELKARLAAKRAVTLGFGAHEGEPLLGESAFVAAPEFGGHVQHALDDIADLRSDGRRVVVITRQAERMCNLLREKNVYCEPTTDLGDVPPTGSVQVVDGIVMEGGSTMLARSWCSPMPRSLGGPARARRPAQRRSVAPRRCSPT